MCGKAIRACALPFPHLHNELRDSQSCLWPFLRSYSYPKFIEGALMQQITKALDKNDRSCYYRTMSKGKQTYQAIVNQALSDAVAVGLEDISLGTLASSLKLSKSGLFAHFKSKQQ